MVQNNVQFAWHATERVLGRYKHITNYATVQNLLQNKPLRNGTQKVIITRLPHKVTVEDDNARNGKNITGDTVKAVVNVTNNTDVEVITIVLE